MKKDIQNLTLHFWCTTIFEVSTNIHRHTALSRAALASCTFIQSPEVFENWLNKLEDASNKAVAGSQNAKKFIDAFGDMSDTVYGRG